jgi:hypothetical protein
MDFEKVLEILTKEFTNAKIRYALIGGFALGAWGILRSTMDLDFLADSRDLEKIEKILNQYDYKCIYKTENVSQYVSDIKLFGAIDFLHAFRKISLAMIKRSKDLPVFDGKLNIRVVIPEDLLALNYRHYLMTLQGKIVNMQTLKQFWHILQNPWIGISYKNTSLFLNSKKNMRN